MATKIIKAWIDGAVQDFEVEVMEPSEQNLRDFNSASITTIMLLANAWEGYEAPYSQVVTIDNITPNTRVDLTTTASQTASMQDEDIAFIAENDNGIITIWSLNGKPEADYEIQATLTEVFSV